ncbi:hypothetical protein RM96_36045 [Cupriavidus sp. IDO]|nr:hypothetical protein RM96_36045 [Cupriavidus sp. IDO]
MAHKTATAKGATVSDAALVKSLAGFRNGYADVNGVRLHYVVGGKGEPLVLLPGWPETWWAFHKVITSTACCDTALPGHGFLVRQRTSTLSCAPIFMSRRMRGLLRNYAEQ